MDEDTREIRRSNIGIVLTITLEFIGVAILYLFGQTVFFIYLASIIGIPMFTLLLLIFYHKAD